MTAVEVREAGEHDIAAIGEFWRAAWREAGPGAPGFAGASDEVIEALAAAETIRERIGGPDRRMHLAIAAGEVVALAGTRRLDGSTVELAGIIVLQRLLGSGIGTRLLNAVRDAAGDDGATTLVVRTESDNERALGFYAARGFVVDSRHLEDVEGTQVAITELACPL